MTSVTDGTIVLAPTSGSDEFIGFAVEVDGERHGTVALRREGKGAASVRWNVGDAPLAMAISALNLILDHAFGELGFSRVEARIPVDRTSDIRAASIAGMRREGITRQPGEQPDQALMARLLDDPPAVSRDGFIAILNAGLPTKRVISQGVLRDDSGRVLLCELTYKAEWDLPGGVVEVGEAPAAGLVRELQEELGITVDVKGLITVNWLPAWRGWDDACIFVFDLGIVDAIAIDSMTLQPTEIKNVHWCDRPALETHATAASLELLTAITDAGLGPYREAPLAD